ncbi:MAG TPA: 50S ribosomal protein L18 [Patescibacteria group bacterium]|jgi:large subunit ribosomal protein L18|nr:50S ribosomal protein L18 [Patescibacteria group bacterium]
MNIKNRVERRKTRIRAKVQGTAVKPRLSVFRSNKHIYAQIIDDVKKQTLTGASEQELKLADKTNKSSRAKEIGLLIAKKAAAKKVTAVVFDKGAYRYHGRVKAVAEGAREGGLKF